MYFVNRSEIEETGTHIDEQLAIVEAAESFSTELEKLLRILEKYEYDYGTNGESVSKIIHLGIEYFGDNKYLSLDRSKQHYHKDYVSCEWGRRDVVYSFSKIEFS